MKETLLVQQSLINNLFFLRTIRDFALNIQLSFYENNQMEIDTAEDFGRRSEELLKRTIALAENRLPKIIVDSDVLVTDYTMEMELLTEKLFGVNINTDLAKQELELTANDNYQTDAETTAKVEQLNKDAQILGENFLDFCESLLIRMKKNELFSYSYPLMYGYMIRETILYLRELDRLIEKSGVDPTYISGYEYRYSESMKNLAQFIQGLSDPDQMSIVTNAENYEDEYEKLMEKYRDSSLTPDSQKVLNEQTLELTEKFQGFVKTIIKGILNKELYFIVEPLFFDNTLTEINYFLYLLRGASLGINK